MSGFAMVERVCSEYPTTNRSKSLAWAMISRIGFPRSAFYEVGVHVYWLIVEVQLGFHQ